jgi:hypothetical protein
MTKNEARFGEWLANFIVEGHERFGSVEAFTAALAAYNSEKGARS